MQRFSIVVGHRGLLGRHLQKVLARKRDSNVHPDPPRLENIESTIRLIDAHRTARKDVRIHLVNCAAYTNMDEAEKEPRLAFEVNAMGVAKLQSFAHENGLHFTHISTDAVFHGYGENRAHPESDMPIPGGVYGASKAAGERMCIPGASLIVRTANLYGEGGRNMASIMLDKIKRGDDVIASSDRYIQPTWAQYAATRIAHLMFLDLLGTFHVACEKPVTWFQFAMYMRDQKPHTKSMIYDRSSLNEYTYPRRPRMCTLKDTKLREHIRQWTWSEQLTQYISCDFMGLDRYNEMEEHEV